MPEVGFNFGSFASYSSKAGASAKVFFCREIYGAKYEISIVIWESYVPGLVGTFHLPTPFSFILSSPRMSLNSAAEYCSALQVLSKRCSEQPVGGRVKGLGSWKVV